MNASKRLDDASGQDKSQDNIVDMRLARPTEPRLVFFFSLDREDEQFWGLAKEESFNTNLDIAYKLLGCTPQEVSDWLKLISQYVPDGYLKKDGQVTKQGLIELFQYQYCCAKTVVARGEDWDILAALNMAGNVTSSGKRDILKDSRDRAIAIPNLHPAEFEALIKGRPLSAEQIAAAQARVKINPYKVGYLKYVELLELRWKEYQAQDLDVDVINLDFQDGGVTAGLAHYNPSLNKKESGFEQPDVHDLIPVEQMSQMISSFKQSQRGVDEVVKRLRAKSFQKGFSEGIEIGNARYVGIQKGAEAASQSASEMLED